jgi:hypothetical protein
MIWQLAIADGTYDYQYQIKPSQACQINLICLNSIILNKDLIKNEISDICG